MLSISKISKHFGPKTLFKDLSFQLNAGDRVGLVGANGAGKSTLFSIILARRKRTVDKLNLNGDSQLDSYPKKALRPMPLQS